MEIKKNVDDKVLLNTQMLKNENYFEKLLIQMLIDGFEKQNIPLDSEAAIYINKLLVKEYLNEYNGKGVA